MAPSLMAFFTALFITLVLVIPGLWWGFRSQLSPGRFAVISLFFLIVIFFISWYAF